MSALIIVAIARQKTHRVFQKRVLLLAIYLLACAIISNVLISIYITQAQGSSGIILSKLALTSRRVADQPSSSVSSAQISTIGRMRRR